jgi:hypothetical protein
MNVIRGILVFLAEMGSAEFVAGLLAFLAVAIVFVLAVVLIWYLASLFIGMTNGERVLAIVILFALMGVAAATQSFGLWKTLSYIVGAIVSVISFLFLVALISDWLDRDALIIQSIGATILLFLLSGLAVGLLCYFTDERDTRFVLAIALIPVALVGFVVGKFRREYSISILLSAMASIMAIALIPALIWASSEIIPFLSSKWQSLIAIFLTALSALYFGVLRNREGHCIDMS